MVDNPKIHDEIIDHVAEEVFTIPPLIGRSIRGKLLKTALSGSSKDIAFRHLEIMKILGEAGTLHITAIGDKLRISSPQMTRLIDRLVNLKIAKRQTDEQDRRTINIKLTGEGLKILHEHEKKILDTIKSTLSSLDDQELKELSASLRKLRDIFSKLQ